MKYFLSILAVILIGSSVHAQITITASDMPVAGDTLRYSNVSPAGTGINTGIAGPNLAWNYIFMPISQAVDTYQLAFAVNPLYVLTVGPTAYGYKVADSLPGLGAFLPVSIQELYTFFDKKTGPERYEAKAFGANISGFPVAANYSPADVWYFLPLAYNNTDSSDYALDFSLATFGRLKEKGYRKTVVDAWGTIQTPYYTTPVRCLRVRSEIHEIDSISFSGTTFGLPRVSVEYKWLVKGDHYPALWVTGNVLAGREIISSVKYRDKYIASLNPHDSISVHVKNVAEVKEGITAYPVPAINGKVTLTVPADWKTFVVQVFDAASKEVAVFNNERELNIQALAAGQYIARIVSGDKVAFVRIVK
jgi:hypothetical protein